MSGQPSYTDDQLIAMRLAQVGSVNVCALDRLAIALQRPGRGRGLATLGQAVGRTVGWAFGVMDGWDGATYRSRLFEGMYSAFPGYAEGRLFGERAAAELL